MQTAQQQEVLYSYSTQQAVEDGLLAEILPHKWGKLTGGRPLLATSAVLDEFSLAAVMEIWNAYVTSGAYMTKDAGEIFNTRMNGKETWVMFDGVTFTVMFPSDY